MSVYTPPPAFVNHVLDDGTIVGQSSLRGGHADADVAEPNLPTSAEIEAFMEHMQSEQANAIVLADFQRDSNRALRYVKQHNRDAEISINRTYAYTTIGEQATAMYCVVIFAPKLTQQLGAGHGVTMNDAVCAAVRDMQSRVTPANVA